MHGGKLSIYAPNEAVESLRSAIICGTPITLIDGDYGGLTCYPVIIWYATRKNHLNWIGAPIKNMCATHTPTIAEGTYKRGRVLLQYSVYLTWRPVLLLSGHIVYQSPDCHGLFARIT